MLFADSSIWENLDADNMPYIEGVFNIADYSLLLSRDEAITEARKTLNALFGNRYPERFTKEDVIYGEFDRDSLAVLKKMIYEGKEITGEEMLAALRNNFEGYEILRAKCLNKVPKYGNDVKWVDELGVKWAKYFRQRLCCFTNYRGGVYHTGMYTVSAHVPMGENVGASPDGRRKKAVDKAVSPAYNEGEPGDFPGRIQLL